MKPASFVLGLAFIPGLCDRPEDPSKGVPPEVWRLRRTLEKEVTRDENGKERITEENLKALREAFDGVCRWENFRNPDVCAEVLYLLPRFWHWDQREALRDLLVVLGSKESSKALQAEATENWMKAGLEERRVTMLALLTLHKQVAGLTPAERASRVVAEASGPTWDDRRFGARRYLLFKFAEMALIHAGEDARAPLEAAVAEGKRLEWAKAVLAKLPPPR
jgi:hypothetical protein